MAEIDRELEKASAVTPPLVDEAAALFEDLPALWGEATQEERRQLLSPLVERVYVDLESKRIKALAPAPAFRELLSLGMETAPDAPVLLLRREEITEIGGDGGDGGGPVST